MSSVLQLYLENYTAEEGKLFLYINHNQEEELNVERENLTVTLGNNTLDVLQVQTVENRGDAMSFLFLVDVSGSLDKNRMESMKEILTSFTNNMRDGDNICIIAMGDELRSSGFLTDEQQIREAIDALEVLHEDTNLYQGIEESIQILLNEEAVSAKRCLVVLSDGAEDNTYGITREEVTTIVQNSHIPVYTVGMVKNTENQTYLDNAKILGSFARVSAGGNHYVPALDDMEPVDVADSIWNSLLNGQIITVDTSSAIPEGKEVYLEVTMDIDGVGTAQEGMNVWDSRAIIEIVEEETEVAVETETIEAEENVTEETVGEPPKDSSGVDITIAGIGIGIVLLALVLVLFLVKRNKDKNKSEKNEEEIVGNSDEQTGDRNTAMETQGNIYMEQDVEIAPATYSSKETLQVQLFRLGNSSDKDFVIEVGESFTLGRDPQRANFALAEDKGLSGVHCTFRYRNGSLVVEDNASTNGTYVNGIPIKNPMTLNPDDVLLVGSYEYRVYWKS